MFAVPTDGTNRSQSESICALVLDACGGWAAAAGWTVKPLKAGEAWIEAANRHLSSPPQGWKLHISATIESAATVLRRALPVILRDPAVFKVAASLHHLDRLNSGEAGPTQAGKFITVYPVDDAQAVRLAVALDLATSGLRGPLVPSDRPLRPGSLVHYRYGAFVARQMQTPLGDVVPAILAPDGSVNPDRRAINYSAPGWAVDPFISAGVVIPRPRPSLIVGGHFLSVAVLRQSPRSTVRLAVDTRTGSRCVLKQVRDAAGMPGERLRHEATVLQSLAPDSRFPRLFDLFEHDRDLYLAMEHCDGLTLEQRVTQSAVQGRFLPAGQVIAWGRSLAEMLSVLHDRRIVHGDLKAPNVIVAPENTLRLIDFETGSWLDATPSPEHAGTPGYISPQRADGCLPTTADDIYSLGALLYFMATAADPSHAPDSGSLLDRPPELINPATPPDLTRVIARCLQRDPSARFASMADVAAALAAIDAAPRHAVPNRPSAADPAPEPQPVAANRRRSLVRTLSIALCDAAIPASNDDGLAWRSTDPAAPGLLLRDINRGSAGAVLALAEAVATLGGAEPRRVLNGSARWLLAAPPFAGPPLPGLYVGEAGIGAALLRAGQVLDDLTLIDAAEARGRQVASLPHASPDLFNGSAGRLRFHLFLWDATGNAEHLRDAIEVGDHLLDIAEEPAPGERCWRIPANYDGASGRAFLGYAHGAAGIADALLDLYDATGQDRFAAAARDAGRWLARQAEPALDDGSGVDWPDVEGGRRSGLAWCHGATGIGRYFLHAAACDLLPTAGDLVRRAARTAAHGARWAGPTQCHGLAGAIEFLLDCHQADGGRTYLADAEQVARLLRAFLVRRDRRSAWHKEVNGMESPDLMVGYAGVLACLLRLSAPDRLPHILSRGAFRPRADESRAVA